MLIFRLSFEGVIPLLLEGQRICFICEGHCLALAKCSNNLASIGPWENIWNTSLNSSSFLQNKGVSVELFPRDFQGATCQVQEFLPLLALTLLFSDASYCYTIPHPEAQWPAWQPGMGKETVSSGVPAGTLAIPGDSAHTEETWECLSLPSISQFFIWWICSK